MVLGKNLDLEMENFSSSVVNLHSEGEHPSSMISNDFKTSHLIGEKHEVSDLLFSNNASQQEENLGVVPVRNITTDHFDKFNSNNYKPDPSSVSIISKEMNRLCSILTTLFENNRNEFREFSEEQYRWHWINILKCTSIDDFSPYQVIFAPYCVGEINSNLLNKIISDLVAYYNFRQPSYGTEHKPSKGISKRGCYKKRGDIITSKKPLLSPSPSIISDELKKTEKEEIRNESEQNFPKRLIQENNPSKHFGRAGRKSTKENAARILQMCLESGTSVPITHQKTGEENVDYIPNSNITSNKSTVESRNESQVEELDMYKDEINKVGFTCQDTNQEGYLEEPTSTSPIENECQESIGSSNRDYSCIISISRYISFKLSSKIRRKVPKYLYVKWSRERTRVGGSFVITKGKGYEFRFPPRELTIPAFQEALKAAINKRIELYGPIDFSGSSSLNDGDFTLDKDQLTEIEKKLELYCFSDASPENKDIMSNIKRKCIGESIDDLS
ncbi:hypothetical protein HWI79_1680 [Cryptosporidium felis]|nr:hypothetical protein HWI79_1680 [Cryptosporidium felis]